MKKAIVVVLALALVFAFTSLSFAAEKKEAAPMGKMETAPAKEAVSKQITGEVSAVDAKANTVTVKGKKGDVTVSVDDKTKIMADKDKKALADIKAGDKVTVKYTETDGKNTAKSIDIKTAAVEKKAPAPAEKKETVPMKKK